ncbi:MAG: FAD-linked oxidase C-terminal domain-containing protein [Chloroflexota bacterium]
MGLVQSLAEIVGDAYVLWRPYDVRLYCYDASIDAALPEAVVLPETTAQVAAIAALCAREGIPITPRGAGTGLSGGSIPVQGGLLVGFARMNKILEIDLPNMRAVVQPGVVNLHLTQAVKGQGLYFVPDPSSQKVCTIGGNIGENSGGPHTLLYGVTVNHVLGLEIVLPDGKVIQVGSKSLDAIGYDLTGLLVGSEGTCGLVTAATVRLVPLPERVATLLAIFPDADTASEAVSALIARGIVPAALEMMDHLAIQAVEAAYHAGYPRDAGAVLLIEVEGLTDDLDGVRDTIVTVCREQGAPEVRVAQSERERAALWAGRKGAFGAMGRLSPDYYTMDGVIPRSSLPAVLREVARVAADYGLRIPNVFHAGDGNLHPLILFDSDCPGDVDRVKAAGDEILRACAAAGGSLSGEHGIGIEKNDLMHLIFSAADLETMAKVKDAFDPTGLCNPCKIFPTPGRCMNEQGRLRASAGW